MEVFSKGVLAMLEIIGQENVFDVALGATILIWVIIGAAYCRLILGNRIAD